MGLLKEGSVLSNRFRIEKRISRGENTEVYRCFDITQNQHCALKILGSQAGQARIQRFKKEFQELHNLRHPFLITTYDFAEEPSLGYYFTCELINGVPVTKKFKKFHPEQVIPLMIQICQIFKFLHSRSIIHADLEPSSLMVIEV
ncbi:protein kinase, partial [candidate division CSSED10-310 bacterium]